MVAAAATTAAPAPAPADGSPSRGPSLRRSRTAAPAAAPWPRPRPWAPQAYQPRGQRPDIGPLGPASAHMGTHAHMSPWPMGPFSADGPTSLSWGHIDTMGTIAPHEVMWGPNDPFEIIWAPYPQCKVHAFQCQKSNSSFDMLIDFCPKTSLYCRGRSRVTWRSVQRSTAAETTTGNKQTSKQCE